MSYILIIIGYYGYATAEFDSKSACDGAATAIRTLADVKAITPSFRDAICVPKGDVK